MNDHDKDDGWRIDGFVGVCIFISAFVAWLFFMAILFFAAVQIFIETWRLI